MTKKDKHRGFNLDADPANADWPKRTWDIHGTPEFQVSVILSGARPPAEVVAAIDNFNTLPAARAMPADVRTALAQRRRDAEAALTTVNDHGALAERE